MNAPFHVPPLRPPQGEDPVLREDVEAEWVDALLVDDDEGLRFLLGVDGLVADEVLELDNLPALRVGEAPFGLYQLLALLGGGVEEPGVDFTVL